MAEDTTQPIDDLNPDDAFDEGLEQAAAERDVVREPEQSRESADDTAAPSTQFRDFVAQHVGTDLSAYESDDDFVKDIGNLYQQAQRALPKDEYERFRQLQPVLGDYAQNAADFQKWKAEQQAQAERSQPEAPKYQPPQLSEKAARVMKAGLVEYDRATEMYKTDDPSLAAYVNEINDYHTKKQQIADRMLREPDKWVREAGLEDWIQEQLKTVREQTLAEVRNEYGMTALRSQLMNPANGIVDENGRPTEYGQKYDAALSQLQDEYGITELPKAHKLALQMIGPPPEPKQPAQETETPAPQRKQKQDAFIEKSRRNGHTNRLPDAGQVAAAAARATHERDENEDTIWHEVFGDQLA